MGIRVVGYDDLPVGAEPSFAAVGIAGFGAYWDARLIRYARDRQRLLAEYAGLFALDGREVVGQLFVLRLPFSTTEATTTVSGIGGVAVRPDHARSGLATLLLTEAHAREAAHGHRLALLWTNRSWGAYDLYRRLGYRDLYLPPLAVRRAVPRPRPLRSWRVDPGQRDDLSRLEEVHRLATQGRPGFRPRPVRVFQHEVASGEAGPSQFLVVRQRHEVMGYARVERDRRAVHCSELLALDRSAADALLRGVERSAEGRMVAFGQSVVTDHRDWLIRRGYHFTPSVWQVLMVRGLAPDGPLSAESLAEVGYGDARFVCMRTDRF